MDVITMKSNTVSKWWNNRRIWLSKRLESVGLKVKPLMYEELSEDEQGIIYDFWFTGQFKNRSYKAKNVQSGGCIE
jgi:hypothetical protein